MTAAQRGIYYAQQIDPDVPMSVAAFVEFGDDVEPDIMDRSVATTCAETESGLLRLVATGDAEPRVLVDHDRVIELGRRDFSEAADPRAAAMAWIDDHRAQPTDLYRDDLLQTFLLRLGDRHTIWYCWGHHLAFDGYAAMYMMLRVAQHYTAMVEGTDVPPASIASMADIAAFDAQYRASESFDADREHWTHYLLHDSDDGAGPEPTSLSTAVKPAAPTATVRAATLPDSVVDALRDLARAHDVRPASVVTAAVAAYLARISDADEATLSLPMAARDRDILRTSAGLTSNVVPIRARLGSPADGAVTVGELLAAVNSDIKQAVRHQRFRHEDITGTVLGAPGGRRGFFGPMVNVMLFFEHIDFGPLRGELNVLSTGPVEDASVNVYDGFTGGMRLDLEANPNVYAPEEITTHHDRIVGFLERFVHTRADRPVTSIPVMDRTERAVVDRHCVGERRDGSDDTLVDLLVDSGRGHPDHIALIGPDGEIVDRAEFTRRADALAAGLRNRGVGPESVVGVSLPRGIEQTVALHAIIRSGAAFLPLDPTEPAARLEHILDTARPDIVITPDGTPPAGWRLDAVSTSELAVTAPFTAPDVRPEHPAYVLFTSGSTGKPKGVMISHRAIVNRLRWMQDRYRLGADDRVLQKTPATFDVSVWEFFWPALAGATLVIPSPDGHRDPWYLRDIIAEHAITTVHFVPSMLSAFAIALNADDRGHLGTLRRIITSGEALTPATVAEIRGLADAPIHNLYGPTEAAIDVTHHDHCGPLGDCMPIGSPVWNCAVHVLDHRLDPQPIGAVGELYLGGVQLARGYRNRADLTAGRFVADPFGGGGRLYRTGDLVRCRSDGELEYLGRSDSQIKVRGQRVELGEIESALVTLDRVHAAAVVVRDDPGTGSVALVAHVATSGDLDGRDLRAELSERLPDHMVPGFIMFHDDLPTTANGKLDRRALPVPETTGHLDAVAPRSPAESFVAEVVTGVLGLESVSVTDNFFAIGGNSLSATRVAARLSRACGRRIALRVVFDAPDIAGIARAVAEVGATTAGFDAVGRSDTTRDGVPVIDGPVPLSPAQHRLWLAAQLDPDSAGAYNIPFTVRLVGDLDVDALRAALNDVIGRHEPLRTRVREYDGVACLDVVDREDARVALSVVDVDNGRLADGHDHARAPFDLEHDLPIRARLVRTDDDDHRLTVAVHHIAADGWSLAPLATDLADAYRARREGRAPGWRELPISYSQVSAARHARLAESGPGTPAFDDLQYWTDQLRDAPHEAELPVDRPRPRTPDTTGATVHHSLSAAQHHRVRALAAANDATVFMVLHAAVAALLRTLSTASDIVVGTPVSGRGDADVDDLVGMFVNTVALRTRVDKNLPFRRFLAELREHDIEAFTHADLPFDRLVTELNPDRSGNIHPFFQVSVAVEDSSAIELSFAGLSATASRIETGQTKFDLQFTFVEHHDPDGGPAGLGIDIDYATALFDRSTIDVLATRLRRLIAAVGAHPDTAIGDIGLLDPHEQLHLVPAVGAGRRPVEHLTRILARAALAEPDRVAVTDQTTTLTYGELDAAANRLARLLIENGAGPEGFVAVSLPRSVDWVVTLWAVARTGAAWVPIDPTYPTERIRFMLDNCGPRVLVTTAAVRPAEASIASDTTVIELDDPDVIAARQRNSDSVVDVTELTARPEIDHPAYLIYTSGTTGTPKGVVVSHRGLADFAAQQVVEFGLTPQSRTLHLASPSFDASVLEVLMAVSVGATMHVAPAGIVGGTELAELMRSARISHAFLTPSLLTTMSPDHLPDLETLVIGGEHPNPEVVRRWSATCALFNAYGPTETTVVATISDDIGPHDRILTIGRPIRGIAAIVLDERLQPVSPGAVGELYIAGGHLARGYHGVRPLTSKHFVANPFGDPGERMYRTGDLVRWTPGRELEFRGRADHQTKIRGHRIELGEIDAALVADPLVTASVTTTAGVGAQVRLVSYVTVGDTDTAAGAADIGRRAREIRERLTTRLPRHMIPSAIVELDEIPTTPVGKVDSRALPDPTPAAGLQIAIRTETERSVAAVIAEQLGIDVTTIGRDHDFFELGGNSLSATQIVGRLDQISGGTGISVRDIFDHPTVAELATLIAPRDGVGPDGLDERGSDEVGFGGGPGAPLPSLHHDPETVVAPGAAQQQLWFLNQTVDERSAGQYNIAFALDLVGDVAPGALTGALRHAIDRHEPLRTIYPDRDGRPTMEIRPVDDAHPILTPIDIGEDEWSSAAEVLARTPFDLTRDLPIRAVLHRVTGDQGPEPHHKLTIVVHHIAADGWSMAPFARDIAAAYADLRVGRAPTQAPLPVGYRDYLRWRAENLAGRFDESTTWWRRELDGLDSTPILLPDPAIDDEAASAGVVEVELDSTLRESLVALGDGHTTEFMTMHAVFAALLHRLHADPEPHVTGTPSDVVIGTPVAGRNDPRLSDLVGMFVNSVVLRTPVDGSAPFTDLLDEVRRRDLEALSQADLPFDEVVAAVNPPRTDRHPLFSIALAFDATGGPSDRPLSIDLSLDGLDVVGAEIETGAARFDLELRLRGDTARFTYATDVFGHSRIESLAADFVALCRQIAATPGRPIDDLALHTDPHPTDAPLVAPTHLASLLDITVDRHPDAVAVVDGSRSLRYADLDRRTRQWADMLRGFGVGAEDVVAVALDRSIDSVTAIWAITRAGATVAPLDPRHPTDRIQHMLSDSGALLAITDSGRLGTLPRELWWLTTDDLDAHHEVRGIASHCDLRNPDSAAYVIYTSGSTGRPKGVTVSHRGLAGFAAAQRQRYDVGEGDRTLHFASPGFDASILEFLLAFTTGATMIVAPPTIYGGDELIEFLAEQRITHAFITPSALAAAAPAELPWLRCLGVGGEASTPALVHRWGAGRRYLNNYGPTETTVVSTISAPLRPGDPITIGPGLPGVTAMVLDHRLRPLPAMVPGELYLAGPGVARGYLGRPGLTSTRFVATSDGAVMYRTGDIVHRDSTGVLVHHGRGDNQVKVRGFRIELEEVSAALAAHPAVDFATTLVRGTGPDAVLAAYVTLHDTDNAPSPADLRAAARDRLPRQMVPSSVTVLDRVPLTPNGKLDHRALPEPTMTADTVGRRPATPAEAAVIGIVADVLDVDPAAISPDDGFFDLGGTSLQATSVTARLNRFLDRAEWRVRDIFDAPSLAALASRLPADAAPGVSRTTPPACDAIRPSRIPLAPVQRRLWALARSAPESTEYLVPFTIRLGGPIDLGHLRGALTDVVTRHTSLRTVYPVEGAEPVGIVTDSASAVVGDLPLLSGGVGDHVDFLLHPIDVTTEPPLRVAVVEHGPDDHTLVAVVHHIAADGASLPILVGDLLTAYRERVGGREIDWEPAALDYRDYAVELGGDSSDEFREDRDFWMETLAGAPAETTVAPVIDAPAVAGRGTGASVWATIEPELRHALVEFARERGTTPFTVLHTALTVLLHRLGVGDDLVIGAPVANRTPRHGKSSDFGRVVGMFVNTLALRTRVRPDDTVASLLDQVRGADADALGHLDLPFDDVVAELNPTRELGRHPLFQVALSVHDHSSGSAGTEERLQVTDDVTAGVDELGTDTAKFDLQFTVTGLSAAGGSGVQLTYATDRYTHAVADGIVTRFLRVMRALVSDPERAVGDVRITDPLEVAQLCPANGPNAATPATFADLLADAVRRSPDALAAVTDDDAITYTDLDQRSNRLARVLLGRGVGDSPESVVAMAVPRSVTALVAIWAIVKSGAAYVPVDPTYPAERIRHMLDDSGAQLVVTTSTAGAGVDDACQTLLLDDPATVTRLGHSSPEPLRDTERTAPSRVDQLAYIIYTSGSTGRPKGVLVPHAGLAAVRGELRRRMRPEPGDRVLHFASPSFDASVLEFLLAAAGSATLAVVPTGIYGGSDLEGFIQRHRVSHAFITPAAVAGMDPAAVPGLRTLAVGGEAFGTDLVRRWAPQRTMINVYGPTETTVITTGSAPLAADSLLTMGTPNNGVGALVLDRRLHPVPTGVAGELYLIGDQVTRGYHRRPQLTATRYLPIPMVAGESGAGRRMYRTGDLVRWTDDERLEYLTRADGQVQIRGFRIELGEIDDALAAHPAIDFAVTVVDDSGRSPVLRSHVTTRDGTDVDVREHLAARLPRHMLPASVIRLDDIPLTPSGKLDRAALPTVVDRPASRAPRPGPEQEIAAVFADALDLAPGSVGADDGFFDLGGNSLLATTVATRLTDVLGHDVPVKRLFAAPTPAELAEGHPSALENAAGTSGFDPVLRLRGGTGTRPPLFVVHPAIGLSWSFTSLLPHVAADRGVYGLQNPTLSGGAAAGSITELAADYVARIRAITPHGPYHLVGWSLGGLIAHEMAVQLEAAGHDVEQLTLLDSFVLSYRPALASEPSVADLLAEFGLATGHPGEPSVGQAWQAVRAAGDALGGLTEEEFGAVHETFRQATPLAADWRPGVFGGDVTFVTAAADPPPGSPAFDDWKGHVGGRLDHIVVDCSHARMLLGENVSRYARAIDPDGDTCRRTTTEEEQ
ncbi:amino acid adenylation domain-containing protein [Gordonia sp. CPCC 206044]